MTIDERLDKLTERHEALTQTVELLTLDVREISTTLKQGFSAVTDALNTLLAIAQSHETRITKLEK